MNYDSELKYIFSNVNEWLKFAEAKHAGIILFNSALLIGVMSSYQNIQLKIPSALLFISLFCFCVSVFFSLISQFPITTSILNKRKSIKNPNFYFFGDLARLDEASFINAFLKDFPESSLNNFSNNLVNQIIVNSRITKAKFRLFKFSVIATLIGSLLIILPFFIVPLCQLLMK